MEREWREVDESVKRHFGGQSMKFKGSGCPPANSEKSNPWDALF